jgi:hypothetical protein
MSDAEMAKVYDFGRQAREIWIESMKAQGIEADAMVEKIIEVVAKHEGK